MLRNVSHICGGPHHQLNNIRGNLKLNNQAAATDQKHVSAPAKSNTAYKGTNTAFFPVFSSFFLFFYKNPRKPAFELRFQLHGHLSPLLRHLRHFCLHQFYSVFMRQKRVFSTSASLTANVRISVTTKPHISLTASVTAQVTICGYGLSYSLL